MDQEIKEDFKDMYDEGHVWDVYSIRDFLRSKYYKVPENEIWKMVEEIKYYLFDSGRKVVE